MNIAELARQAGVTPRTVRYYVEQGLLPPPGRGRIAEYTAEHLKALRLIQRLKEHYLPLDEIRDTLQRLTAQEVEDLLAVDEPREAKESGSAVAYIASVMDHSVHRQRLKEQAPPAPTQGPAATNSGYAAQQPTTPAPGSPPPPVQPYARPYNMAAPPGMTNYMPAPIESTPSAAPPAAASTAPSAQAAHDIEGAQTWQRVALSPDIELHYRVHTHPHTQNLVARLMEAFGQIIDNITDKNGGS